jgi:hypothetical protein
VAPHVLDVLELGRIPNVLDPAGIEIHDDEPVYATDLAVALCAAAAAASSGAAAGALHVKRGGQPQRVTVGIREPAASELTGSRLPVRPGTHEPVWWPR